MEYSDDDIVRSWSGFDSDYYSRKNHYASASGESPIEHFVTVGQWEGLDPNEIFDSAWYCRTYALNGSQSPILHYLRYGEVLAFDPSPLFEASWYRRTYLTDRSDQEPLAHYLTRGCREGCEPNRAFDTAWYAETFGIDPQHALHHYRSIGASLGHPPHPLFDVDDYVERHALSARYESPLAHYLFGARAAKRSPCRLFDVEYYSKQAKNLGTLELDPFWHFSNLGWREGLEPCPGFSTRWYLANNQDVDDAGSAPLRHYLSHGAYERRRPHPLFDPNWYVQSYPDVATARLEPLSHFLTEGWRKKYSPSELFDTEWYLENNLDVRAAGVNPLGHYCMNGWREGRNPNPLFDVKWFLRTYPHVAAAGHEPLAFFLAHGATDLLDPSPGFSTSWYLEQNPDVREAGHNPLAHYLHVGKREGRQPKGEGGHAPFPAPVIDPYAAWLDVNPDSDVDAAAISDELTRLGAATPKISVVMPVYNTDPGLLSAAIDSVRGQLYTDWELCVADDASQNPETRRVLAAYAEMDSRICVKYLSQNVNISACSNAAASLATGEVIALLDHDDVLHAHALAEVAIKFGQDAELDIVYTDDDKIDMAGVRYGPQFKPGWSPALLFNYMYFGHLFTFRRELFERVGGFREGFEGSQDYDLALRVVENARKVGHVARVLYHWRAAPGSTAVSGDAKPAAFENGRRAVDEALQRRGVQATVAQPDWALSARVGIFEPRFGDEGPSVCIIIPTRNKMDLIRICVDSISKTTYRNFEILIVDNESDDPEMVGWLASQPHKVLRVASPPSGFNYSYLNNVAAKAVKSEYILFLNNDTEVISPHWLSQMVGYAELEEVGVVGARLLYADGRIQHGGIVHGLHEGTAGHAHKLLPSYDGGYMSLARTSHECAGVTAACMLARRDLFLDLGGLDEENFAVAYNDVDYSYRVADRGLRNIYCSSAELFHYEGRTRGFGDNPDEIRNIRRKYRNRVDPYHNPNLSLESEQFEIGRIHLPVHPRRQPRAMFVSHNLNHEGAPNSLFELCRGLHETGRVEARCVSPYAGPLEAAYADVGVGVEVVDHPLGGSPGAEEFEGRLLRFGQALLFGGVDVVVANTAHAFWAVEAARLAGLPSVWIVRESEPWASYFDFLPSHMARVAYDSFSAPYKVVFVAQSTLDAWKPLDSVRNFTLIRNGLDAERLRQAYGRHDRTSSRAMFGAAPGDVVFTCIGTFAERKGQIDIVRAYAAMPDEAARRCRIVLVGARPSAYTDQVMGEIAALGRERLERVCAVGETGAAKEYLVGSDVFICSSRIESYPRVTLEAMAAGLPLITTGAWGLREQVRENYNALQYEPGDIEGLARHMTRLCDDADMRRTFAARSRPVFESLPDYDYMLDRYARVIREAVGSVG